MRNRGLHIRFTAERRFRLLRLAAGAWLLSLAGWFGGCDYDRFDPPEPHTADVPVPTMSIATLRSLYKGDPVLIAGKRSVVVSGNVTTSDREGNFFRSFFIEDETGAVEIRAGLYDLHTVYRLGQQVTVVADSLTLGLTGGVLQLGLASSAYETDYMDHRVVIDRHVFRNERFETVIPRPVTPARLDDAWLGTLVRFDGMRLDGAVDTTWALPASLSPSGTPQNVNLKFRSSPSDSIYVYTSGYANFAGDRVPTAPVSLTGILMQGKVGGRTVYQVKLRDLKDVEQ